MNIVTANPRRVAAAVVAAFAPCGGATVHEAQVRTGLTCRPAWEA